MPPGQVAGVTEENAGRGVGGDAVAQLRVGNVVRLAARAGSDDVGVVNERIVPVGVVARGWGCAVALYGSGPALIE